MAMGFSLTAKEQQVRPGLFHGGDVNDMTVPHSVVTSITSHYQDFHVA